VDGSLPDCSKRPNVVNNSWGDVGGDPWYSSYVNTWRSAGILPVFAVGNSGPGCNTASSPGDYRTVIGVGATTQDDVLWTYSSKGPSPFGYYKPNVVAPGDAVRTAFNNGDYLVESGTSFAAPHAAGLFALLLSVDPTLARNPARMYTAMIQNTVQDLGAPPAPTTCGGRAYNVYPNYIYGFGRLNALGAVTAVMPIRRPVTVTWNVTVPSTTPHGDSVYVTGNFQDWNPGSTVMTRVDPTHWTYSQTFLEGEWLEYKYTRGSWNTVEKGPACEEVDNREALAVYGNNGTVVLNDTVARWRDSGCP
jgi:subtilisin family serine protease